jgi:hypothetical protein
MVKYRAAPKGYDAGKIITTKSPYGSHEDMVIDPAVFGRQLNGLPSVFGMDENQVFCQDDKGYYLTEKSRLDNGLADPNRYSERRNNDPTISSRL